MIYAQNFSSMTIISISNAITLEEMKLDPME